MAQRVAIVHDWLNGMRGGEKVLEVVCELFPGATLFTLFHEPDQLSPTLRAMDTRASFANRFGFARRRYRYLLPLFPWLLERFDLREFDLVISSSHCVAKGARARTGAPHVCYCHAPMRYVWDQYDTYFGKGRAGLATRLVMRACRGRLQRWDVASSRSVTRFIANSRNIARKIESLYGRQAAVIHPPVDAEFFTPPPANAPPRAEYYFVCSAMVPYKRLDVAIDACRLLGRQLVIAGDGPERRRLEARVGDDAVQFVGHASNEQLRQHYREARAFLFPGEEDFGITPLEAMACGQPVIAYARGGALETVIDGETGVFFEEQTTQSLAAAIERFERLEFDPARLRTRAGQFARPLFKERLGAAIARVAAGKSAAGAG